MPDSAFCTGVDGQHPEGVDADVVAIAHDSRMI
jgi:hypothetical protein